MNVRVKKIIAGSIIVAGGIVIVVVVVFGQSTVGTATAGSDAADSTGQSFHPNAWKFAELVENDQVYPVDHVIDGDTLVVDVLGHEITIRLIGMDTPETMDPRKPVECFGPEASAEAKRIFGAGYSGSEIYVEKDPAAGDYDKYGRLLAYVFPPQGATENDGSSFPNGLSYNEYMIEKGYAREYTYMKETYRYQAKFKTDQKAAMAAALGVWNKSVCRKPFSY